MTHAFFCSVSADTTLRLTSWEENQNGRSTRQVNANTGPIVNGLVSQTHATAAKRDALSIDAITSAIPIGNPIEGVNATNTPIDTPSEIRLGLVFMGKQARRQQRIITGSRASSRVRRAAAAKRFHLP